MTTSNNATQRPVLFLDIDGTVNTTRTAGAWTRLGWHGALEPELVARVAALVERTNARVVLSSTWRISSAGLAGTALALEYVGWKNARKVMTDQTPRLPGFPRGDEIAWWLRNAGHAGPVCILDDDGGMGALANQLVQTDPSVGVTDADIARAEALLRADLTASRGL